MANSVQDSTQAIYNNIHNKEKRRISISIVEHFERFGLETSNRGITVSHKSRIITSCLIET